MLGRTAESFASGVFVNPVWRQKVNNHQAEGRSEGTHLDDATNSIEIRLPGRERFIVVLCMEGSGEHTPFTFLDDMPLDLTRGAAIVTLMNKSATERSASSTHVVSCSIASRIGEPGGYTPPAFIPLSKDWQISAQTSPSSTKPASSITESCVYR